MPSVNINIKPSVFNDVYMPYLQDENRYLVFYGGAGSGKSFFVCERYIYKMLKSKLFNLLVVRSVGNTNRDSTFALFKQVINKWKLSSHFKIHESDLRIKCLLNGNEIIFKGLDDSEKLKSVTFSKGELTDVWVEEASEIDEQSFNQLDVRLRGKGTKKQIVVSFNPIDIKHWLKKRFFDRQSDNVSVLHTTYKDNKFLDDEYKKLLESYKETDPYYYDVYCLGQWGVLGKTIFDAQKINLRISNLRGNQKYKRGYFTYKLDLAEKIDNKTIQWIDDDTGYIKLYEEPKNGYPYVMGGDTSGEGSDNFTAHVIDNYSGKQVATLKHQFDEDMYAKQVYCLGHYYNKALVAVEMNYSTYPIKELERLGYHYQYIREQIDSFTGGIKKAYGFRTDKMTRPLIIANLTQIIREHVELINDVDTLEEMLTFIRNEKGRPEAMNGAHDDLVMALAISYYCRGQGRLNVENARPQLPKDMPEDVKSDLLNNPKMMELYLKENGLK